jgi:hypothetical protein
MIDLRHIVHHSGFDRGAPPTPGLNVQDLANLALNHPGGVRLTVEYAGGVLLTIDATVTNDDRAPPLRGSRADRLERALLNAADQVCAVAETIRAPNSQTPIFVEIAKAMRSAAREPE